MPTEENLGHQEHHIPFYILKKPRQNISCFATIPLNAQNSFLGLTYLNLFFLPNLHTWYNVHYSLASEKAYK